MATINVEKRILQDNIEIRFRYVYETVVIDNAIKEKTIEHSFIAPKNITKTKIKAQIKEIIEKQLEVKQADVITEDVVINLEP